MKTTNGKHLKENAGDCKWTCLHNFVIPHGLSTLYRCSLTNMAQDKPYHEKPSETAAISRELCPIQTIFNGIVSDSNNIFLWHESEDIHKKKLISKISVDSNFTFSSCAWLCVFHCSHRLLCWIKSRVRDFLWKLFYSTSVSMPLAIAARISSLSVIRVSTRQLVVS